MKSTRVILGAIAGPMGSALIASLFAIGSGFWVQSFLFSFVVGLGLFVIFGAICHMVLRWKRWHTLRQYLMVMFVVATLALFAFYVWRLLWVFGNGGSEFHFGTQVIENGDFTVGGVILTFTEAMV